MASKNRREEILTFVCVECKKPESVDYWSLKASEVLEDGWGRCKDCEREVERYRLEKYSL